MAFDRLKAKGYEVREYSHPETMSKQVHVRKGDIEYQHQIHWSEDNNPKVYEAVETHIERMFESEAKKRIDKMVGNLATIRKVIGIQNIHGADKIELAMVDGWECVIQKGNFVPDQLGVYIQIDSFVPATSSFAFLGKSKVIETLGEGYQIKTIKLKGKLSQGLLLPISDFPELVGQTLEEGVDVTELLQIKKYEKPIPGNMKGRVKGNFPSFIPKIDQERAQNLMHELIGGITAAEPDWSKVPAEKVEEVKARWNERKAGGFYRNAIWEVSTKLDGSSITIYAKDGQIGVCSRNLELDLTDKDNVFIKTSRETGILDILKNLGKNWAIQGELMGPGVQDNHEGLGRNDIFIYDIYDIDEGKYLTPDTRQRAVLALGLRHVPAIRIMPYEFSSMDDLIANATGPSMINPQREGLVYKSQTGDFSFKVINNDFLLEKGE